MEVKIPAVGESITEVTIAEWKKKDGDYVQANEVLILVETDKATVEVAAEKAGKLSIKVAAGQVVPVGTVVGDVDTAATAPAGAAAATAAPAANRTTAPAAAASAATTNGGSAPMMPAARRLAAESGVPAASVEGTGRGGRILKEDVQKTIDKPADKSAPAGATSAGPASIAPVPRTALRSDKGSRVVPMTTMRKRIAARLVEAKQTAAILTTFNEVDMTACFRLRDTYGEKFKEKYGTRLGFLGLFAKACVEGLRAWPQLNAFIDGDNIIYNDFFHFGVAVSTEGGLVVPVIRDVDELSVAGIELEIKRMAIKARDGKLGIDDMRGGTFTISNGGVFGSLMSTPILNPPQSGILGLHKVEDRPVAIKGKVEIRPMMYIALSYDHRIVDGKEAVSFLVKVKECIEDPERLLLEI